MKYVICNDKLSGLNYLENDYGWGIILYVIIFCLCY